MEKRTGTWIKHGIILLLLLYLASCFSMRLSVRETAWEAGECMLYYIVNADGMKGLGHSIIMLVDEEGCGTVISYNGMQRSLTESLMGKSGVGKMSIGTMSADETETFLQSGDLHLDGDQLTDNYDVALYRPITAAEYGVILEQTEPYLAAQEQFTVLYEKWAMEENASRKAEYQRELVQMGQGDRLPVYQIYTNNCDHVARQLISSVDMKLRESRHTRHMTPNGNIKAFGAKAQSWGVMMLGSQSFPERILMFLMIF